MKANRSKKIRKSSLRADALSTGYIAYYVPGLESDTLKVLDRMLKVRNTGGVKKADRTRERITLRRFSWEG